MYDLMMDRENTIFGVSANREQACDKESERHKLYLIVFEKESRKETFKRRAARPVVNQTHSACFMM